MRKTRNCSLFEICGLGLASAVGCASAISGAMVASAELAHCGGIYAGTSGVGMVVDVDVGLRVAVGRGVAVGGTTNCVTKLHAINVKIKDPKAIRFVCMVYL